jgi:hypothetical protein
MAQYGLIRFACRHAVGALLAGIAHWLVEFYDLHRWSKFGDSGIRKRIVIRMSVR